MFDDFDLEITCEEFYNDEYYFDGMYEETEYEEF